LKKEAAVPMIIHGFNKNIQLASDCISKGFYLSFGKATLLTLSLQNTLKELPLDKIFLETDTSDFEIEELYQKVAQLKNISLKNLELQLLENLQTIINK
jgi:TatD DNase family protein